MSLINALHRGNVPLHSVPLSSFRLNNIPTEYVFDMRSIMEISAPLPYNLKAGVEETIEWLREMGEI